MRKRSPFRWVVLGLLVFWMLAIGAYMANADSLTFDCTPPGDAITGAKIQFNADPPLDAPLVSTCGTDPATKVTCTDPASKTICYPDTLWPAGAFVAKATVTNVRATSEPSIPLGVPGIPGSPSSLKTVK